MYNKQDAVVSPGIMNQSIFPIKPWTEFMGFDIHQGIDKQLRFK